MTGSRDYSGGKNELKKKGDKKGFTRSHYLTQPLDPSP